YSACWALPCPAVAPPEPAMPSFRVPTSTVPSLRPPEPAILPSNRSPRTLSTLRSPDPASVAAWIIGTVTEIDPLPTVECQPPNQRCSLFGWITSLLPLTSTSRRSISARLPRALTPGLPPVRISTSNGPATSTSVKLPTWKLRWTTGPGSSLRSWLQAEVVKLAASRPAAAIDLRMVPPVTLCYWRNTLAAVHGARQKERAPDEGALPFGR